MGFQYFDKIIPLLQTVEAKEKEHIEQASTLMREAIQRKASIFIFGASHAGILAQEMFYRAGGLIPINPIFGREIMLDTEPITKTSQMERLEGYGTLLAKKVPFQVGDILILHSVSGRNPVTVEMALYAQEIGVKVISITNVTYSKSTTSRHSSGKRLFEASDITIDNHGDIGDAMCSVKGLEQKVAPSSTVVGATILNAMVAEVCEQLVENGEKYPPIYYSANLDGGDELNQKLLEKYQDAVHYRY